uniref:Uncharacterized protein n=1 Tax=Saimiri boliviensis boliviensis TaxID=39432 RepID=A0A2K6U6D1_SAIBB
MKKSLNLGRHDSSVCSKHTVSQKRELLLEAQTPVNTRGDMLPVDVLGTDEGRGYRGQDSALWWVLRVPTRGSQDLGKRSVILV